LKFESNYCSNSNSKINKGNAKILTTIETRRKVFINIRINLIKYTMKNADEEVLIVNADNFINLYY